MTAPSYNSGMGLSVFPVRLALLATASKQNVRKNRTRSVRPVNRDSIILIPVDLKVALGKSLVTGKSFISIELTNCSIALIRRIGIMSEHHKVDDLRMTVK